MRETARSACQWGGFAKVFDELGEQLPELAAQLAKATQPGHFNRVSRQRQSRRRNLAMKHEQKCADSDYRCASPGAHPRDASVNRRIIYAGVLESQVCVCGCREHLQKHLQKYLKRWEGTERRR